MKGVLRGFRLKALYLSMFRKINHRNNDSDAFSTLSQIYYDKACSDPFRYFQPNETYDRYEW